LTGKTGESESLALVGQGGNLQKRKAPSTLESAKTTARRAEPIYDDDA